MSVVGHVPFGIVRALINVHNFKILLRVEKNFLNLALARLKSTATAAQYIQILFYLTERGKTYRSYCCDVYGQPEKQVWHDNCRGC